MKTYCIVSGGFDPIHEGHIEMIKASATAGITAPKKKLAVLRRLNVQDLRNKEGKMRAAKFGKLLKQPQK